MYAILIEFRLEHPSNMARKLSVAIVVADISGTVVKDVQFLNMLQ